MARTGPAYVESEDELYDDIDLKLKNGSVSDVTADGFRDLYAFAKDVGDTVDIGEAKNANFQCKVDAHQGDYENDPSVFTATISGEVKIWPARMIMDHDGLDTVAWSADDYYAFERAFHGLNGTPASSTTMKFDEMATTVDMGKFQQVVTDFIDTCREKQSNAE
jgi:hypothetical protein